MLPLGWEEQTQSPEVAVWNCSRGRPGLRSSSGSAFSRVQVTGDIHIHIHIQVYKYKKRKKNEGNMARLVKFQSGK